MVSIVFLLKSHQFSATRPVNVGFCLANVWLCRYFTRGAVIALIMFALFASLECLFHVGH